MSSTSTSPPATSQSGPRKGFPLEAFRRELSASVTGEVRFDKISRALYSTDASVYQIEPLGVVVPKTREDVMRIVELCRRYHCPLTARGGGTSQAGQAIGPGILLDTSKYFNRILELNKSERWARVEPGIVLAELNDALLPDGLRFAPDISTANRATVGGMVSNNSCGARSVYYGKTIDHVLELWVLLSDGNIVHLRDLTREELEKVSSGETLEAKTYQTVRDLAASCRGEIDRRYPKILRRVGGYNLDAFVGDQPFNLAKLIVGSEGTLGVVLEAKIRLVALPRAKAVLSIQFADLLESLEAVPVILKHRPSAVEVMDKSILDNTRESAELERMRRGFIEGDPGSLLVVEFYDDDRDALPPRLEALERELILRKYGYRYHRAIEPAEQAKIWNLREAALGLSMSTKGDARSMSFVEDTAVAPEKLRNYIDEFLKMIRQNGTTAGVYAHASVGCLHVRPVVNLKTEEGVRRFEAIANDSADLVLKYGGALSGEHGDGMVRGPFVQKMFGPILYEAFRTIKKTFDPEGLFNPGKIVDTPPLTSNLRYGAGYQTPDPPTFFDYSEYGGMGRAVDMCSGLGVCRKKLEGTMCPSYMATRDEAHATRGRANTLRLAMTGRLGETGLGDQGVYQVLDLCLECRACKAECPVGVDMARFKSEFLADYWSRHGTPLRAHMLGNIDRSSVWASRLAPLSNWMIRSAPVRWLNEKLLGIDRRRLLPEWTRETFATQFAPGSHTGNDVVVLFNDTFTNYFEPEIGMAAVEVLQRAGLRVRMERHRCCGRPLISQGLLGRAREYAEASTELFYPGASRGEKILFCEPSCLSAMREDVPSLLRGEAQKRAAVVAGSCLLFEEYLEREHQAGRLRLALAPGPKKILLHGHCHQKSMGLLAPAKALLARIPDSTVVDLDAGCCGMAGSFGYLREHYEISRAIGERKLLPAARNKDAGTVLVAAGTSCRHQVQHFTGTTAIHPAMLLRSLLKGNGEGRS
jgi:FAD/FMN-containing dehydrogenase/Fe-S oxidoreductase